MTRSSATGLCQRRSRGQLAAVLLLLVFGAAPLAFAQTTAPPKKPKKGAKPAASASASATAEPAPEPPPPPPAAPAPAPAPPASAEASEAPAEGEPSPNDMTYTKEDPGKKYYFAGLRYRGTVIPKFLMNLFVNEGATVFSNTIGAELDMRQDSKSLIPWIAYTSYSTGDILFLQKGKDPTDPNQYSVVNSGLGAIYLGIDELWSTPIADHLDFEYGFGVGLGFVFGNLQNNWVYEDPLGSLVASNGIHFRECQSEGNGLPGTSCQPAGHQNSTAIKIAGYVEPNWFQGGSVPVVFPHIAIPQLSLRYKPVKQVEGRLSLGFSLTGFWFGLSVDYGLEKPQQSGNEKPKPKDKGTDKEKKKPDSGDQDKKSDGSLDWRDTL